MDTANKAPRGTADIMPGDSFKWRGLEQTMLNIARLYGYREIRTPVFEHTEVFSRGVGDATDIVQKEMYTFEDKGGRSITLRPEMTAGVVRAVIERGEIYGALPLKVCYIGSCYRYEKPQAGRLREFHQFGAECFGAGNPSADAETILFAKSVLDAAGIGEYKLEINSIGCPECRKKYNEALRDYFSARRDMLCETCAARLDRNPMRILDCKVPRCGEVAEAAPVMIDYLCAECREHFEKVKSLLAAAGAEFTVNPKIVRGLDYYTKTVFEFVITRDGTELTVCGGGRYDGLVRQMGGPEMPALGFAIGLERLISVLENNGAAFPPARPLDIYVAPMGETAETAAAVICENLRKSGLSALSDISGRGFKAQMKYADKCKALYLCVIGENELQSGICKVKAMDTGVETATEISAVADTVKRLEETAAYKKAANVGE